MTKSYPDKWIRKAIRDALAGLTVDGNPIPLYDYKAPSDATPESFVLISSQNTTVEKGNKIEYQYEVFTLIEISNRKLRSGNPGSRLAADNILEAVKDALNGLTLDVGASLNIVTQSYSFPSDQAIDTNSETIFRKFLRLRVLIN